MRTVERRQFGRRRTTIHAMVLVHNRQPEPCTVCNISANGALVHFSKEIWLPYNFELVIQSDQFRALCEWRHSVGTNVGLTFISNHAEALAKYGLQGAVDAAGSDSARPPA